MAIVTTSDAGQSFGDVDLFRNITVAVERDSKIALVGPNGIGKTTLLMILAGMSQPTSGKAQIAGRTRIGYLRQGAIAGFAEGGKTVFGEIMTAFAGVQAQE